jgi:penicillin V acylase-like amidase (Ntn superfamily)
LTYYSQKGIDLSTAIYQIIGDQAIITMIWKEQYQVLLNEPSFEQKVTLDEQYMTKI